MNSSAQSASGDLHLIAYVFWAMTFALTLLVLLVFQRQRSSFGISAGIWFVIGLGIALEVAAQSLGGRLASLLFHVISLITVCAGVLGFGVYAGFLLLTRARRKAMSAGKRGD